MKIGILTLPLVSNNGGILQAYALQAFLKTNGYEAILIDRRYQTSIISPLKRCIKSIIFRKKSIEPKLIKYLNQNPYKFINKYIQPQSKLISSNRSLKKYIDKNELEAIIVGSDQVWRLEYSGKLKLTFFLNLKTKKAIKRISYAASFGIDTWNVENKLTKRISELLKNFDAISVRENTGVKICREQFSLEATQLIDPTFLLKKEDYIELINLEKEQKKVGDLFYYFLDSDEAKLNLANNYSNFLNLKAYTFKKIPAPNDSFKNLEIVDSVTSWLRGFMDAKYILTDSFHGCIFSIIFNKPFLAVGNIERGLTRFSSILKQFKLEERLILDLDRLDMSLMLNPIDYEYINMTIENERKKSMIYLKTNLEKQT
jgi:hypothetical protein